MRVGFIGLGGMGAAMARNLLDAGHTVLVWNRSSEPVRRLADAGAIAAGIDEAFATGTVLSMLSDDAAVAERLLDPAVLDAAPAGALHVNMATVSTALAQRAAREHAERGLRYLAAPVFGRTDAAAAGNLTVVAGGDPAAIAEVAPLFDVLGRRTWPVGEEPAQANLVKIFGNYLIACSIEAMAEATAVIEAGGLDPSAFIDVLTDTLFTGPVFAGYGGMIGKRRYEPVNFRLPLGFKDVQLALTSGQERNVPLPFGGVLRDAFLDALAHGQQEQDWAAVAETARRRAGLA
ncbi:Beta-hydroxyacid dehydrogenase, 3-hydroxyisobutyrate dehydrogenase [Frankia canadensis]|uniref:Beta-hydroxyacid dehydrogenase, 3-hydroxyisobutyrate dehydrogenase n=1 Tax=Frankia canadensis TaxID=1836972 RepID=A0A2I2KSM7_9ACTN|nr:NAD(P)-dependent oxidoreductase [Frankia canadensis]SNQ48678.1 Beta-hydroxyacid dehydrogenase, 3-hydroxyisobutyrate dehydrogenase [Frankia canadensis]SOU55968.1 Beta-hydroxyacid dehydrogenase, 3-hydroxyisobutyrate dehydrogenase [Frankia canadensis]